MKNLILTLSAIFILVSIASAQGGARGFVKDAKTNLPIEDAQVIFKLNGVYIADYYSDSKGFYEFKSLDSGCYSITIIANEYNNLILTDVNIKNDQITILKDALLNKSKKGGYIIY